MDPRPLSRTIYATMLRLMPRSYDAAFRGDILGAFDQWSDCAARAHGPRGVLRMLPSAFADLAGAMAVAHGRELMRTRDFGGAAILLLVAAGAVWFSAATQALGFPALKIAERFSLAAALVAFGGPFAAFGLAAASSRERHTRLVLASGVSSAAALAAAAVVLLPRL